MVLFPLPMIFAILLNELQSNRFKKTVQTISYLPHFVSTVVLVSMITTIVSPSLGIIGKLVRAAGGTPVNYLADPNYFVPINVISGAWQSVGWDAVIYVSALSSIDPGLYEAARIDGAGRFKQILHVTLPTAHICNIHNQCVGQMLNVNFERSMPASKQLKPARLRMLPTFSYKTVMESTQLQTATCGWHVQLRYKPYTCYNSKQDKQARVGYFPYVGGAIWLR